MKYHKPCTHERPCGKGSKAHAYRLTRMLVDAFRKLVEGWSMGRGPTDSREVGLTHVQLNNWSALKHWGILEKDDEQAMYHITPLGIDFYNGDVAIDDVVGVMDDRRIPDTHEAWLTHKGSIRKVYIHQTSPAPVRGGRVAKTHQASIF